MATLSPIGYTEQPQSADEFVQQVLIAVDTSNGSMWALGDLYNNDQYSDLFEQVLDNTKKSLTSVQRYAGVCKKFSQSRRRASLSFSHHETVRALEPSEQDYYLDMAEKDGLSRDELVKEIKGASPTERVKGACKIADLIAVLTSPEYGFKEVDFVDFSIKAKVLEAVA